MATEDYDAIPTHVTTISAATSLTPGVRRLTFSGGLERLRSVGPDSFVYVLLPPPGRTTLPIGTDFTWSACWAMPEEDRPVGAYYTIRHHRPDKGEVDIDVVLHHDHGAHATGGWVARAQPGDPAALWGPRTAYHPPADAEELLLVADDTGLPALCAIAESLRAGQRARAVVEVADVAEQQPIHSAADVEVTWLHRDGVAPGCSPAIAKAMRDLTPPSAPAYVWGGGESRIMTEVRKQVRHEWGLPRERVDLTAYWRHADSPVPDTDE